MPDINTALAASQEAIDQLVAAGERVGADWTSSRVEGKWSPSQIVEHVARTLEESANVAAGRPAKFRKLPAFVQPIARRLVFTRVLRTEAFPKARTNEALDPVAGPATPAEGRVRLETAHQKFADACRRLAADGGKVATTLFGSVPVLDYVRFIEIHTRHHGKQLADRSTMGTT